MVINKKNNILSSLFLTFLTISINIKTADAALPQDSFEQTIKKIPCNVLGIHQAVELFEQTIKKIPQTVLEIRQAVELFHGVPQGPDHLKHAHMLFYTIESMELKDKEATIIQNSHLKVLLKKLNIMQFTQYVAQLPQTTEGIRHAYTTFETLAKDEYKETFSSLLFTFVKDLKLQDFDKAQQEFYLNKMFTQLSNQRLEEFVTEIPQNMQGVQKAYKKFINLPYLNNDLFLQHATRLYGVIKGISLNNPEHIKQRHTLLRHVQKTIVPTIKAQELLEEPMFSEIIQDYVTMSPQQQGKRSCQTPPTPLTLKALEQHNQIITTTTQDHE